MSLMQVKDGLGLSQPDGLPSPTPDARYNFDATHAGAIGERMPTPWAAFEERRRIGEQRFLYALNYCMPLSDPDTWQLAANIAWPAPKAADLPRCSRRSSP
ncbi:hypothetical protein ACFSKM_01075 [Ancylobacter dichloromethanicus]